MNQTIGRLGGNAVPTGGYKCFAGGHGLGAENRVDVARAVKVAAFAGGQMVWGTVTAAAAAPSSR